MENDTILFVEAVQDLAHLRTLASDLEVREPCTTFDSTATIAPAGGSSDEASRAWNIRAASSRSEAVSSPWRGSGYRNCPPDAIERLRFIKRAQELGFCLDEIKELLALAARSSPSEGLRARP